MDKQLYKLTKAFPGMEEPVGTVFGTMVGSRCLCTESGRFSTTWISETYFDPYIGEHFIKL